MDAEICFGGKLALAESAAVAIFAAMTPQVMHEAGLVQEALATLRALMPPLALVHLQVSTQASATVKGLPAVRAAVLAASWQRAHRKVP